MRSIKLFLLAVIAVCFCTNVNAVELGDYMEIDGVPSIVIYVDASGEHGLVMSATTYDSKEAKAIKKYLDKTAVRVNKLSKEGVDMSLVDLNYLNLYLTLPPYSDKQYKKMEKQIFEHLENLSGATSAYGQENAEIYANYCAENGLDMSIYFPDQAWAAELGHGWFIPGNAELEKYAEFMGAEYNNKKTGFELSKTVKDAANFIVDAYNSNNNGVVECWSPNHYRGIYGSLSHNLVKYLYLPIYVKSSTLINSSWTLEDENSGKVVDEIAHDAKTGKLNTDYYALGTQIAAVVGGNQWVAFYENHKSLNSAISLYVQYHSQIVAVKEF